MTIRKLLLFVCMLILGYTHAQGTGPMQIGTRADTAVVKAYGRVPVFYHCRPLHSYRILGMITATPLVSYSSKAFEKYATLARKKYKEAQLGILINDLNFGTDSFYVVSFDICDSRADTAVFETPIFLGAKPTKPYKVVRVLNDQISYGSLNKNLCRYLREAGSLHIRYDGIMVRDIHYAFTPDQVFIFRWKSY